MKLRVQAALVLLYLAISRDLHAQANQSSALSLQGFSGIINTPNGHVQQEGTIDVLYSNQVENIAGQIPPWEDSYLVSVGMFKFAEVGGRLTNTGTESPVRTFGIRDLSVNWKLSSSSLTSRFRFSPALAFGMQDVGGGGHYFKTTYGVASADPLGWLRLSVGYGHGPDRMKGAFGGIELRAHEWVTLLADYDTQKTAVGGRLTAPALPYIPARLTATFSAPIQSAQGFSISGGFRIPLDYKEWSRHGAAQTKAHLRASANNTLWGTLAAKPLKSVASPSMARSLPAPSGASAPAAIMPAQERSAQSNNGEWASLDLLRASLIKAGFVNVRVGLHGKTLVVEYENIRYNHNELDAVGVVAGIASLADGTSAEELRLVVKRKGLALLQIESQLVPLRNWLDGTAPTHVPIFKVSQKLAGEYGVGFVGGNDNPGRLKPSIMVYPSVITLVGTEHGLFDYQLSIKPELQVPLWAGATAVARADLPVAWSPNLNFGQIYASSRTPEQMDRLMFFQALPLAPGLVANLGVGKILTTDNGTLNELSWTPEGGMNRLKVIQSWGRDGSATRNVILGSYRFFLARHDLAFEGTAGRFYGQDSGFMVNMQRFFGDSSISLYFKDTVTRDDSRRWLQGGMQIEFPLTRRRDMKARPIQIRGHEDWGYAQETGIVSSTNQNENYVKPNLAIIPEPTQALGVYFYDRERLNADYIHSHMERIREAWRFFRNDL